MPLQPIYRVSVVLHRLASPGAPAMRIVRALFGNLPDDLAGIFVAKSIHVYPKFGFSVYVCYTCFMKHKRHNFICWAAGFFDGEGCIQILRTNRPYLQSPTFTLTATVTQKLRIPLDVLKDLFGGCVCYAKTTQSHLWVVSATKAHSFLKLVQPYLQVKGEQVNIALAYWKARHRCHRQGIPPEEIEIREHFRLALLEARRAAKTGGTGY